MNTRVTHMLAASGEPLIQFSNDQSPLNTTDIHLAISSGSCTIDWGDGNTTTASGASVTQYSNDYTSAGTGTYNIVIYGRTKNITDFRCFSEPVSGDIVQFKMLTSLTGLQLYSTSVSGDIADLSGLISLVTLSVYSTSIDTYTQGTLPDWEGTTILIHDLGLDVTEVSDFLVDVDNATGSPGNGYLDISGTNAIPNAGGLTAKGNLEGKSWTVVVST